MSNPLFNTFGSFRKPTGNTPLDMIQQVQQFRQQMQGKDPREEISKLLQSGRINQQQLDQAQQMAQQMQGILRKFN